MPSTDAIPAAPNGAPAGCWFDHKAADFACDFFPRYLRHTEGEWAGQPFHLSPDQRQEVRTIFGWKRPDGTRLIRTFYKEVPRKNGKTEFAAGLAILLLVGDGEFGGQGYAVAVDKDQAAIVFRKAATMVLLAPKELKDQIEVLKTSVYCPALQAGFRPLSSDPRTKHGFSPSFAIYDETHEWRDGEVADVVHKGTAARRQPLEIFITTAGVKGRGFGWELHDRAVKVLAGTIVDPSFYAVIYAAGEDDDWTDEATWAKANPNLGVSPKIEFLRAECAKAKESPRPEGEFKRYHLNIWTETVARWLNLDHWRACAGPIGWKDLPAHLKGRECFAGVDLSVKIDITALVLVFPPEDREAGIWHIVPRFFLPRKRLDLRVKRDRVPYDTWAKDGAITLTEGDVVDYAWVEHQLGEDGKQFTIRECAFDKWNATQFATRMMDEGLTMVDFGQGYRSMSEPTKELEALHIAHRIAHGGHPVLDWMAQNITVETDPAGNLKPSKATSGERIDGLVAAIMALGRAIVAVPEGQSFWEKSAA